MDFSRERIAVIFFPTFPLFLIPNFIGWNKQNTLYHQKPSYFFLTIGAVAFSIYFSSLHLSSSFFSLKFTRSIYYLLILSVFTSFLQFHLLPYAFFSPVIFPLKWLDAPIRERVFGPITTPRQSLVWLVSATDQSACALSQPMSALFDIECWTVKICNSCCEKVDKV